MNKKWLAAGAFIILLLTISSVYVFIPGTLSVATYTKVNCTPNGAVRIISQEAYWEDLSRQLTSGESIPGEPVSGEHGAGKLVSGEINNKTVYRLSGKFFQRVAVTRESGDGADSRRREGAIKIFPLSAFDSITLEGSYSFPASLNPLKRVLQYEEAKSLKKEMTAILASTRYFLEKKENVYGIDVRSGVSKDTAMVATKWESETYPGTSEVYGKIGLLRKYITSQGARATGYPMLNAARKKDDRYEVMVAIPTDRELKGTGVIFPRRFVSWKLFVAELRGGAASAEQALAQLRQYTSDYQHTAMAIPFQSLVTERNKEPDTLKWATRVVELIN